MSPAEAPPFGAVFDWDGVIIDSGKLHEESWRRLATELGRTIAPDSFIRGFGMKSERIIAEIHCWSQDATEILRLAKRKEELYRQLLADSTIEPLPGVVTWLSRLRAAAIPCAIASSTPRPNIDAVLVRLDLRDLFPVIVSAEDVIHGKPNPEVFLKAAERLQLEAKRAVVFEDAHVGIQAAHAAGMTVVAVATTHSLDEFRAADLVVGRLDDLSIMQVSALVHQKRAPASA